MMKIIMLILAFNAVLGLVGAELLTNNSFEDYAEDDYGRLMPTDFGLWAANWDTVGPDAQVVTTDFRTGAASMQIGTDGGDVALTYVLGDLPEGDYIVSAYVKGKGNVNGLIGVDMFSPDWSEWWWGGGTDIRSSDDWTLVSFEFHVNADPKNFNFIVKGFDGTANFLVDDVSAILIPEPATLAFLGLGTLLLRRRK